MSDSSNDSKPKRLSVARNYRQRFQGADGEYIYRKTMRVHDQNGEPHRVLRGDAVDIEGDGITPRRLKALWYAEAIEVADFDASKHRRGTTQKTRNNLLARQEEQRIRAAEDTKLKQERDERRELNALRREEQEQRRLADQAVRAAEDKERREIEDMIADEETAARNAEIQKRIAARLEKQADDAEAARELAQEKADVAREREQVARERQEQAEQEAGEERARLEQASAERREERDEAQAEKVVTYEQREAAKVVGNPNTRKVDAQEQKAEIYGKPANDSSADE